jgi:magnesium transporter
MTLFRRQYTQPGAPPGSVAESGSEITPRISTLAYSPGECEEANHDDAATLPAVTPGKGVLWIDVQGLGDHSIVESLKERFHLHPLAASDVVNVGQRPKAELYGETLFVVLRMVTLVESDRLQWEQVTLFVDEGLVLTFQESYGDCLDALRGRIRSGRKKVRESGADYLAGAVIDAIVDGYFPVLEEFGNRLENLEEQVLDDNSNDVLAPLYAIKRDLSAFRRIAWPLRESLTQIQRSDEYPLSEDVKVHLRDTLDHLMQVVDVTESYRELTTSLVDVHLSMTGQRTNEIMRVLTVVSAMFIPLTFVAGIYGMNFDTSQPGNLPELGWEHGYLFFWGLCGLILLVLLFVFRKLGWLKR